MEVLDPRDKGRGLTAPRCPYLLWLWWRRRRPSLSSVNSQGQGGAFLPGVDGETPPL